MTNAAKTVAERRELASELLGLHRKHGTVFARIEDLKRALRESATTGGENFKEEFAAKGVVKVSGAKPGKFQGIVPEVNTEVFLALSERERTKLIEKSIVLMTEKRGRAYFGGVTVEVF